MLEKMKPDVKSMIQAQLLADNHNEYHRSIQDNIEEKVNSYLRSGNLDRILAGIDPKVKIPLTEDDPADLDEQRAAALAGFFDFPQLQIDQCPYESDHYGLCQLVFLLFPSSHILQLLLFQLEADDGSENVLKMNREISLNFFKIQKPLMANPSDLFKQDVQISPLDEREKARIKKEQETKLERQR